MAERGRIYLWSSNRSFGDGKPRPVVMIAPDAATRHGLRLPSYAMSWLPTTVHADQLQGPLGRLTPADLAAIATAMIQALDLRCLEPWQAVEDIS